MKFLTRLIVEFYVIGILLIGVFLVLFSAHLIDFQILAHYLKVAYTDEKLKTGLTITGFVLLVLNFIVYRAFYLSQRRDRLVTFDNEAGRVSVSLLALEDLLEQCVEQLPEVKDVKIYLRTSRKALWAKARLELRSDENIQHVTGRVQDIIRRKAQDAIGVDEAIKVMVHVSRISPDKQSDKKNSGDPYNRGNIPFQGYRA
ncbi:MAG: alkaline shock response membrane anchor protein AmaP [Candidatus Omnitrophica bacterium]|nr:alkaline shock response membrane anchor protein AmaP [Candidatus Omnitrophota bacterium]